MSASKRLKVIAEVRKLDYKSCIDNEKDHIQKVKATG